MVKIVFISTLHLSLFSHMIACRCTEATATWWCAWLCTRVWCVVLTDPTKLVSSKLAKHVFTLEMFVCVNLSICCCLSCPDLYRLLWRQRASCEAQPDEELPLLGKRFFFFWSYFRTDNQIFVISVFSDRPVSWHHPVCLLSGRIVLWSLG